MKGVGAMRAGVSGLLRASNLEGPSAAAMLPHAPPILGSRDYSSVPNRPLRKPRGEDRSEDDFLRSLKFGDGNGDNQTKATDAHEGSSVLGVGRPLRGDKRLDGVFHGDEAHDNVQRNGRGRPLPPFGRPMRGETGEGIPSRERTNLGLEFSGGRFGSPRQSSPVDEAGRSPGGFYRSGNGPSEGSLDGEKRGDQPVSSLLQKLKLGRKADEEKSREHPPIQTSETDSTLPESSSQDAHEIFRKMKETGLIPNAVAMLDGLCKDGLIQEAMKLFGLMREKGTIPEVVIYTAVVEGFCKAAKFDDAKRVFRKMQSNGISPNAFSYKVLIEGLYRGKRLEDSVDLCLEMLDAGHSPSVVTFTGMVDEYCKEKGLAEAEGVVRRLRERGLAVDDRAVREHLDKKGPYSSSVWEAIFGKKTSQRPF